LGVGGMGAVFEVSHRVTGRCFAIKWLLPSLATQADLVTRFMREAQAACRIDHPNVVQVYDVGQARGSCFMVMELLRGEPLSGRLKRVGRLSVAEVCQILVPVCQGVHAAHSVSVVHRDLKPDNIFLCRTHAGGEAPKVLDFGVAKLALPAEPRHNRLTASGVIMGTPLYMAPEQLKAQEVDARTDVYALGVILYEALSGRLPFETNSYAELVVQVLTTRPRALQELNPSLPDTVIRVVETAMALDPAARFASAEALGRALARCETSLVTGEIHTGELHNSAFWNANRMNLQAAEQVTPPAELTVTPSASSERHSGESGATTMSLYAQNSSAAATPYAVEAARIKGKGGSRRSWFNLIGVVAVALAVALGLGLDAFQWVRGALHRSSISTSSHSRPESARGAEPLPTAAISRRVEGVDEVENAVEKHERPQGRSSSVPGADKLSVGSDTSSVDGTEIKSGQPIGQGAATSRDHLSDTDQPPTVLGVSPTRSTQRVRRIQSAAAQRLEPKKTQTAPQDDPAQPQNVVIPKKTPRKQRAPAMSRSDFE